MIEDITNVETNSALFTKEERHRLDVELVLKITMPEDWNFE